MANPVTNPMQTYGTENIAAMMKTFSSVTEGIQTVAAELADYNRASFERGTAVIQELARAKDVGGAMKFQTDYWRSAYENLSAEMTKIGALWAGLAKDATALSIGGGKKANRNS